MDMSVEETRADINRPDPFLTVLEVFRAVVRKLTGFFVLSEEERSQAGIDLGGEGRDE
jgi:hypothetical protein